MFVQTRLMARACPHNCLGIAVAFGVGFCVLTAAAFPPRVANTTFQLPIQTPVAGFSLVDAFPGFVFEHPVAMATPPGETNRLFILERRGRIMVIPDLANPVLEVFLDIVPATYSTYNEAGLLGLAFHPGYATNRQLYVYRTSFRPTPNGPPALYDQLSRFEMDPDNPNRVLLESELVILSQLDASEDHNAGDVHFGPDGYLYLSIGEDGPPTDRKTPTLQSIEGDWFGCILRIDVDKKPGSYPPNPLDGATTNYSIPPDNPFINLTNYQGIPVDPARIRTEKFAIGLRNPWRMSFDTVTGNLFVGDVGSALREEVNLVNAGGNYGWPFTEGTLVFPALHPEQPPQFEWTPPLYEYSRGFAPTHGNCVVGGRVYRGSRIPGLVGRYVYGDFASGNIRAFTLSGSTAIDHQWLAGEFGGITTFGVDPRDGELLVATLWSGRIKRLIYTPPEESTPLPLKLSDTGIFTELTNLTPAEGIVPYTINVPFWSDNAIKTRWFSVPELQATIGFQPEGNWSFPEGMFWVKHFELELVKGVPLSRHRLETRVLVRNGDGLYGLTYKWNSSGTDAILLPPEGTDEDLSIDEGGGIIRTQRWHYPSRYECLVCHNANAGFALGFKTAQLNCDYPYESGYTNQIGMLSAAGYFDAPVTDLSLLRSFGSAANDAFPLQQRARSYLSVNCVHCHQEGSPVAPEAYFGWDARDTTPITHARLVDGRTVKPGSASESVLFARFAANDSFRMPPLATSVPDAYGYNLLAEWINTMPLPPWTNCDVGTPLFEGGSAVQTNSYAVGSAGSWLGTDEDAFQFLSQTLAGNGHFIGRIVSNDATMPGARAGLMIRDGFAPDAAYAFIGLSNGTTILQSRSTTGGFAEISDASAASIPQWLRLVREQNEFRGFASDDGLTWSPVGTATAMLSANAAAGMAVAGGLSSQFHNAHFENVSLLSINWISPADGTAFDLPAALPLEVQVNSHGKSVSRVEFFVDGVPMGEAYAEPYAITWTNTTAGLHSLGARAFDESGIRVDAPTLLVSANDSTASAYFLGVNTTIQGNWTGLLGSRGHAIPESSISLPDSVEVSLLNHTSVLWADNVTNPEALLKPDSMERIASAWAAENNLSLTVSFLDGVRREVALYFLDWTTTNEKALSVQVLDASGEVILDTQTVTDFSSGKYLIWAVSGFVRFEITSLGSGGAVLSGVFFDPNSNPGPHVEIATPGNGDSAVAPAELRVAVNASGPIYDVGRVELLVNGSVAAGTDTPPFEFMMTDLAVGDYTLVARATDLLGDRNYSSPVEVAVRYPTSRATFLRVDSTTQGNWLGQYGSDGYVLFALATNQLSSMDFTLERGYVFVRNWFSSFPGALLWPDGSTGLEAEYVSDSFSINLNFMDGHDHLCAFYVCDWGGLYRESAVEIRDASSNLLDSRVLSRFTDGKYYVWRIRGQVSVQFNRVLGGNVGLSGMFIDPSPPPFEFWRLLHFNQAQLADPAISSDAADPDGDGTPNFGEFAMGLDPWTSERPLISLINNRLSLLYSRSHEAPEVIFVPEYSTDLINWFSGPTWVEIVSTNDNSNFQEIWVQSVNTIDQEPQGYLRLRATQP